MEPTSVRMNDQLGKINTSSQESYNDLLQPRLDGTVMQRAGEQTERLPILETPGHKAPIKTFARKRCASSRPSQGHYPWDYRPTRVAVHNHQTCVSQPRCQPCDATALQRSPHSRASHRDRTPEYFKPNQFPSHRPLPLFLPPPLFVCIHDKPNDKAVKQLLVVLHDTHSTPLATRPSPHSI